MADGSKSLTHADVAHGAERVLEKDVWRGLLRRIRLRTRQSQDAEDLLQTAYLRLHERSAGAPVENQEAFLVRTAINLSIDDWRRRRHSGGSLEDEAADVVADPSPRQDEVIAHRVRLEKVRGHIDRMSPRTREVFLLHRLDGLKYREVASRLGISQSAVEKHIAKAVAILASGLEDE